MAVAFGVVLQAEKVNEKQAIEIQHLRRQLFGRRSEKLSPDQLSLLQPCQRGLFIYDLRP